MHLYRDKVWGTPGSGQSLHRPQGLSLEEAFNFYERRVTDTGCIEWLGPLDVNGYGAMAFKGKNLKSHRVAYELSHTHAPGALVVRHRCDNPPCVNPEHLELGTQVDNMRDMIERGRNRKGEECSYSRLTDQKVREIRSRYIPRKVSQQALADEYGVSREMIRDIVLRRKWAHVE